MQRPHRLGAFTGTTRTAVRRRGPQQRPQRVDARAERARLRVQHRRRHARRCRGSRRHLWSGRAGELAANAPWTVARACARPSDYTSRALRRSARARRACRRRGALLRRARAARGHVRRSMPAVGCMQVRGRTGVRAAGGAAGGAKGAQGGVAQAPQQRALRARHVLGRPVRACVRAHPPNTCGSCAYAFNSACRESRTVLAGRRTAAIWTSNCSGQSRYVCVQAALLQPWRACRRKRGDQRGGALRDGHPPPQPRARAARLRALRAALCCSSPGPLACRLAGRPGVGRSPALALAAGRAGLGRRGRRGPAVPRGSRLRSRATARLHAGAGELGRGHAREQRAQQRGEEVKISGRRRSRQRAALRRGRAARAARRGAEVAEQPGQAAQHSWQRLGAAVRDLRLQHLARAPTQAHTCAVGRSPEPNMHKPYEQPRTRSERTPDRLRTAQQTSLWHRSTLLCSSPRTGDTWVTKWRRDGARAARGTRAARPVARAWKSCQW